MHNYCVNEITPMFLTATLPGHKGQVIEKKISSLHMALEKILNVLKEAAHQLHETGLVPECDLHNNSSEIDYGVCGSHSLQLVYHNYNDKYSFWDDFLSILEVCFTRHDFV